MDEAAQNLRLRRRSIFSRALVTSHACSAKAPVIIFASVDGCCVANKYAVDLVLPPRFSEVVRELRDVGVMFVPCSERSMIELEDAFLECPCPAISANNGCVIQVAGDSELHYYGHPMPDYGEFEEAVWEMLSPFPGLRTRNADYYYTAYVKKNHPLRNAVEFLFRKFAPMITKQTGGFPIEAIFSATTVSLGPRTPRKFAGAMDYLMPRLIQDYRVKHSDFTEQSVIICAGGNSVDDVAGLRWAKEANGHALFVNYGRPIGCPAFATVELDGPEEWLETLDIIAKGRARKFKKAEEEDEDEEEEEEEEEEE